MKLRNWLIKKLGGYTRSEYGITKMVTSRSNDYVITSRESGIVEIRHSMNVSDTTSGTPLDEWVTRQLEGAILHELRNTPGVVKISLYDEENLTSRGNSRIATISLRVVPYR